MGTEQNSGPVVVGVDQSDTATEAAKRAVEVAKALGAEVHVLTAVDRKKSMVVTIGTDEFHVDGYADDGAHLSALKLQLGYDRLTTSLGNAPVGKSLADVAESLGAQLIVVGNKRVQGASRVLGSVAGDVLRHAPCDVLVVHTNED